MKKPRWHLDGMSYWIAALSMFSAIALLVAACSSDSSTNDCPTANTTGFPTGRFIHEKHDTHVFEFDEDGSYRYYEGNLEVPSVSGKYGTTGDLYAEMTHDYTASRAIPVTYNWTYDGQKLTFHLQGEDVHTHRKGVYNGQTYVKVEQNSAPEEKPRVLSAHIESNGSHTVPPVRCTKQSQKVEEVPLNLEATQDIASIIEQLEGEME